MEKERKPRRQLASLIISGVTLFLLALLLCWVIQGKKPPLWLDKQKQGLTDAHALPRGLPYRPYHEPFRLETSDGVTQYVERVGNPEVLFEVKDLFDRSPRNIVVDVVKIRVYKNDETRDLKPGDPEFEKWIKFDQTTVVSSIGLAHFTFTWGTEKGPPFEVYFRSNLTHGELVCLTFVPKDSAE